MILTDRRREMNPWEILGIPTTTDVSSIKKAYAKKLKHCRPDEDAEAFQQLREAYQVALAYAKEDEQTNTINLFIEEEVLAQEQEASSTHKRTENQIICNESEETQEQIELEEALESLYHSFERRIEKQEWERLIGGNVVNILSNMREMRTLFLDYFMKHRYLPQDIWILLDQWFKWTENKADDHQSDYKEIIQYIEAQIHKEFPLEYRHLKKLEQTDIDAYLSSREEVETMLYFEEWQCAMGKLEQMETFQIEDIELWRFKAIYYLGNNERDEAFKWMKRWIKEKPNSSLSAVFLEIIECEEALRTHPKCDTTHNYYQLASQYEKLGLYSCASDYLWRLLKVDAFYDNVQEVLTKLFALMSQRLLEQKQKKIHLETISDKEKVLNSNIEKLEAIKNENEEFDSSSRITQFKRWFTQIDDKWKLIFLIVLQIIVGLIHTYVF